MLTHTYIFYLHLVLSCHKQEKDFCIRQRGVGISVVLTLLLPPLERRIIFAREILWSRIWTPWTRLGKKSHLPECSAAIRCDEQTRSASWWTEGVTAAPGPGCSSVLASLKLMGCLSTSDLDNKDSSLLMHWLAYLETANTPPFMDPKQERATSQGTAREKLPRSLSAKVWGKTGWSALSHREENEVI